jgi:curli biogenesis system outer membrane secretion channel CsgG
MPRKIVLCLAAAVALAGCKRESADPASAPSAQAPADSAPSAPVSSHAFSPELTTGIKAGTYVNARELSTRTKDGSWFGSVDFTKKSASDKKIETFYGFDL